MHSFFASRNRGEGGAKDETFRSNNGINGTHILYKNV